MEVTYGQFAKDYDFKNSWKLLPTQSITSSEIKSYLEPYAFGNICFECFFETKYGYQVIGYSCPDKDFESFIKNSIQLMNSEAELQKYIAHVSTETPDMARVGILDYWFETGPCVVWQSSEGKVSFTKDMILERVRNYPAITRTTLNPQGISFYYSQQTYGQEHWMMYNASIKDNDTYILDIERVLQLLKKKVSL